MSHRGFTWLIRARPVVSAACFCALALLVAAPHRASADDKKPRKSGGPATVAKPSPRPAPRSALLTNDAWRNATLAPVTAKEIDALVAAELRASNIEPAPSTSDEQFLRRVTLDLTGKLPTPAEISSFVIDNDPRKRAKVIDKLLDGDAFARHWPRYSRDVIAARMPDRRGLGLQYAFDRWMTEQLKTNSPWDEIVRAMLTADGECRFDDDGKKGAAFFLASHTGGDAANEQAAETARIF